MGSVEVSMVCFSKEDVVLSSLHAESEGNLHVSSDFKQQISQLCQLWLRSFSHPWQKLQPLYWGKLSVNLPSFSDSKILIFSCSTARWLKEEPWGRWQYHFEKPATRRSSSLQASLQVFDWNTPLQLLTSRVLFDSLSHAAAVLQTQIK